MKKISALAVLLVGLGIGAGYLALKKPFAPVKTGGREMTPPVAWAASLKPKVQAVPAKAREWPEKPTGKPPRVTRVGTPEGRAQFSYVFSGSGFEKLSVEQRDALTDLYILCLEKRSELRAKNVTSVRRLNGDSVEVKIGAYPDDGSALRDLFYAETRRIVGDESYVEIMASNYLRGYMDSVFTGFGHMEEVMTIRALPPDPSPIAPTYFITVAAHAAGDEKSLEYLSDGDNMKGLSYGSTWNINATDLDSGQFSFLRPILDDKK